MENKHMKNKSKNKPKLVAKTKEVDSEEAPEGYLKLPPMMDLILFHLSSVTFANEFYHHDAEYRYAFISECMKALTKLMNEGGE